MTGGAKSFLRNVLLRCGRGYDRCCRQQLADAFELFVGFEVDRDFAAALGGLAEVHLCAE
jgi:hypothetical protein